jgi:hypothetical protein
MMNIQPPEIGRLFLIPLTPQYARDRMRLNRARSSMVEQWPFKPLVAGSSPAALTNPHTWGLFILSSTTSYLDVGWNVGNILNSNVLSFFSGVCQ